MTTLYVHRITAIVPESMFHVANCISALLGEAGAGEMQTFVRSNYTRNGANYSICPDTPCKASMRAAVEALANGAIPVPEILPDYMLGPMPAESTPEQRTEALSTLRQEILDTLNSAQVILSFDPANPPAYQGGTVIAMDVDWKGLAQAMGFEPMEA
jgi:hypothetical protein